MTDLPTDERYPLVTIMNVLLHVTDDLDEAVALVRDCYERHCAENPAAPVKADAQ